MGSVPNAGYVRNLLCVVKMNVILHFVVQAKKVIFFILPLVKLPMALLTRCFMLIFEVCLLVLDGEFSRAGACGCNLLRGDQSGDGHTPDFFLLGN